MGCMLSRTKNFLSTIIAIAICVAIMPTASFAADVDVYAEGAYTDTKLDIYIYANINASPILSFGVKVIYPAGLTFTSATKNEDVWFFGNGTAEYPYMEPTDDGTGVVIIGGKLDTADALAGVSGTRVLLGKVHFTHSGMTDFSGVSITYGRGDGTGSYQNFVATNGTPYDGGGVDFQGATIAQRGDANADGNVTNVDMGVVKDIILGKDPDGVSYRCYADANDDEQITNVDMGSIKDMILGKN